MGQRIGEVLWGVDPKPLAPAFPAAAVSGEGVFDTLKAASKLVLQNLSRRDGQRALSHRLGEG